MTPQIYTGESQSYLLRRVRTLMAEPINSSNTDIWAAKFDSVSVEFTEEGHMVIKMKTGLFDDEGNKVAESRPSKSSGKTQVVATTGGNIPVKTLKNGKILTLGLTAYVK